MVTNPPKIKTVTALGRIEPSGEIVQVSASSSTERVEKLLVKKGDRVARIGQTSQMYAVAEIYESDIGKVRVGQRASVTSNALSEELHGMVEHIGLEIQRQEAIDTDPAANIDAKIVEARVRLNEESSKKVAGLSNLLINVKITL